MENLNKIMSAYVGYTFEDMEAEEIGQRTLANNERLSPIIRRNALERIEVIELIKAVYMEAATKGVNVLGMRVDAAFYIATGKTVDQCRTQSTLTQATSSFVNLTDKFADHAVESIRKGANWVGQWLVAKSNK